VTASASAPQGLVSRLIPLPRGGMLVVRPLRWSDVEGLSALYAGLDDESRHRRFFSLLRPKRAFFERMVVIAQRGGMGLVAAVVDDVDHRERVVGEASYELLPDGDGELGITVDSRWRGWLGPYLLDALVVAAASRGVPNLEADVLVTNTPMLAMLRSRGCAEMPSNDWTLVRAIIGTATATPTWPAARQGPRVLVEGAGGHWHAMDAARAAGLEVLSCPGPAGRGSRCPVLAGKPCPLATGADAIVLAHPPDTDGWPTVRASHEHLHPGVPVLVELSRDASPAEPSEIAIAPCADADLVALLRQVAGAGGERPAGS